MSNPRDVSTADFDQHVVARSHQVPVVVDFWAAWCGPCRVLGPILERAAAESGGEWELVKVDVDQNQQLAAQHAVQGIPTVVGYRDGQPASRFSGALPEASVRQWLRDLVPSRADRLAVQATALLETGDGATAEEHFRQALALEASHIGAGLGLAEILLDRDEAGSALELLAALPATEAVRNLRARARIRHGGEGVARLREAVAADADDAQARLALGKALAAEGSFVEAFDNLQQVVEAGGDAGEQARLVMLDLFDVVDDAELVAVYRRRLANALF